jgi:hypothetical protein
MKRLTEFSSGDADMDRLLKEASRASEEIKNGTIELPNLLNIGKLIDEIREESRFDSGRDNKQLFSDAWQKGAVWTVSNDVVDAFIHRNRSGLSDYETLTLLINQGQDSSVTVLFHAMICGVKNAIHIGFCPMSDALSIARITVRAVSIWDRLQATENIAFEYRTVGKRKESDYDVMQRLDKREWREFI